MNTWDPQPVPEKRRRSQRVVMRIPIAISGDSTEGAFREESHTLVINAHGALITLGALVTRGQPLKLENRSSLEQHTCLVVHVGPAVEGKSQVGIEFTQPAPHFWHVAFPPQDWAPTQAENISQAF